MEKKGLLCLALAAAVVVLALLASCGRDHGPTAEIPARELWTYRYWVLSRPVLCGISL